MTFDDLFTEQDICEVCGETAVCSVITVNDGDLIADYLACDFCRLGFVLSQMGNAARERVKQLRGDCVNLVA